MISDLSFKAFLEKQEARDILPADVLERLKPAANEMTTLRDLTTWALQRFPDRFHPDHRRAAGLRPMLNRLWAAFLEYRETV